MKSIISINSLSKTFKSGFKALENVSLDINKGEIFALLGPNGAGKTTLISIITGITIPTSGSVKVNNYDEVYSDFLEKICPNFENKTFYGVTGTNGKTTPGFYLNQLIT